MRWNRSLLRCATLTWNKFASWAFVAAVVVLAATPVAVRADDDLPERVGRIAEFAGQLFLSAQDRAADWTAIDINYPVTSGDNLWVSGEGRAEVDYGGGQFRLAGDTNINVSRLDERQLSLFVAQGRVIVRVRVLDTGDDARIDTPNTQVVLTRPGLYRIDVARNRQDTVVSVREGEALLALATGAQQVLPGQTATIAGAEPTIADLRNGAAIDGFDSWSATRDRRYERGRATAYVSRQMVGYAELDEYGTWESNATYGNVWYPPAVAADWVPYRDGYWTDVGAWGLTWVDAAPWGYAPSHYGRWVRLNSRWAWCPGAFAPRPRWAPALVGWYGGAGWGLTANGGAPVYGWVPLGWGDAYHPWWNNCSLNCWARYNKPYAVDPAERTRGSPPQFSNMNVAGAMTAVAGATLVGRKPVRPNVVPLPASQVASAPLLATAPGFAPGPAAARVYRPGERGTPTPASSLHSYASRHPSISPPASATVSAGVPVGASATSGAPSLPAARARPAPALVAAPRPAGAALPIDHDAAASQALPRDAAQRRSLPPASTATPVGAQPSASHPASAAGSALGPVLPAGAALAPPVRPAPALIQPSAGLALPPPQSYAPVLRPLAVPLGPPATVAPPAPVVVLPPPRVIVRPATDADASAPPRPPERIQPGTPAPK